MDEVRPFLRHVLAGRPVPPERFEEVVHHYELIGGRSPLNEITRRQARALAGRAGAARHAAAGGVGMRNSAPFLDDTLRELAARGARRVLGVIMAAQESPASHGRYREAVDAAQRGARRARARGRVHARASTTHPGFIAANVEHVRAALRALARGRARGARSWCSPRTASRPRSRPPLRRAARAERGAGRARARRRAATASPTRAAAARRAIPGSSPTSTT